MIFTASTQLLTTIMGHYKSIIGLIYDGVKRVSNTQLYHLYYSVYGAECYVTCFYNKNFHFTAGWINEGIRPLIK